ncbi:MAG TPA: DEAD/DEAH box helicase [Candidatus Thermoplasmatota archaeon]|nr:DEAD/DEAH box helicase [Candidatus Thermoplasmatota archaeon]
MPFTDLPLSPPLLRALEDMGYEEPTEIQAQAIPPILKGRDLVGQAQTGTGKTAGFGIPIIEKLDPHGKGIGALILVPTRELADQVAEELRELAKYQGTKVVPIYGGVSFGPQLQGLREGGRVVVGTPGRVMDHMRRKNLALGEVSMLVLDEADRMLDMGFIDDIRWILKQVPRGCQKLLFSATMPAVIKGIAQQFLPDHALVQVSADKLTVEGTEQTYVRVGYRNKVWALYRVLEAEKPELAMVFCRTKHEADKVAKLLKSHGFACEALHGDLPQGQRNRVMQGVRDGGIKVLVTTNVAARGIDVLHTSHVINYDLPEDPEWYVHRVGRTGRMGREGKAITFVTKEEEKYLADIAYTAGTKIDLQKVPEHGGRDKVQKVLDFFEYADRTGMVHFRVDVGTQQGATKMAVFQALTRAARLNEHDLGNVQVYAQYSEFEVPRELARRVYQSVHRQNLLGKPVKLQVVERKY